MREQRPIFTPQERLKKVPPVAPTPENTAPQTPVTPEEVAPEATLGAPLNLERSPYVVVGQDIPSKFLAYPEGARIRYRPYYFGEVKNYSQSVGLSTRDKFLFILEGIETEGFAKLDLTISDFMYLGLLRRMSALGDSDIVISFVCKRCGNVVEHRSKTSEVDIEYLAAPKLPIRAEFMDGTVLTFGPLTVGGYLELQEAGLDGDDLAFLAKCCRNLSFEEAYTKISHITDYRDADLLDKVDGLLYHSVKPIQVKCTHREEVHHEVEGLTLEGLRNLITEDQPKFLDLCGQHYPNFVYNPEGPPLEQYVDYVAAKLGIITQETCGRVNLVEIDSGDILISPFRGPKDPTEGRLQFG